jgi:hypothetical protein
MRFNSNNRAAFGNLAIKSPEEIEKEQALNHDLEQQAGHHESSNSDEFNSMPSSHYDSDESE